MFKVLTEMPLPVGCEAPYRGLAYDGCWFYLTQGRACAVDRLDRCGQRLECFSTCRCYSCLCFDPKECCFWAACDQCPSVLFKLDACFREIDGLHLRACGPGMITGLSFRCCDDQLLVAFATGLALVSKVGDVLWERKEARWTKGVLSLCPYTLTWSLSGGETVARLYDKQHQLVASCPIPCDLCIEAAVLDPCEEQCGHCVLYVLATKRGCYSYLLRCVLECDCPALCPCNRLICRCKPCCEASCACNDALESIALMEAALSHILNAEGEKLQKVIASTCDPCTLLEINKSVNATLINATHLEQVLFHKLEALKEVCGGSLSDGCAHEAAEHTR